MLATGLLAQVDLSQPPTSVAATLALVLVLVLSGQLRRGPECDYHKERADRLEKALEEEFRANQLQAETMHELRPLASLMRKVLEALPQPDEYRTDYRDDPPRTPPRRR